MRSFQEPLFSLCSVSELLVAVHTKYKGKSYRYQASVALVFLVFPRLSVLRDLSNWLFSLADECTRIETEVT